MMKENQNNRRYSASDQHCADNPDGEFFCHGVLMLNYSAG